MLIDKFLDDAIEVDVDALGDGEDCVIGGIMEHIERAGVHSGDSACRLPPKSIGPAIQEEIRRHTDRAGEGVNVRGLMNVQFAVQRNNVYVLEVNPRASRTVPFVSKAIGVPLAKLAARIMVGKKLKELGFTREIHDRTYFRQRSGFPFNKFPGVDTMLGPEMKSTGEVMGIDTSFGIAFAKAQLAAACVCRGRAKFSSACATRTSRAHADCGGKTLQCRFRRRRDPRHRGIFRGPRRSRRHRQ